VIPPQTPYAFGPHPLLPWTTPWVRVTGENLELLLKELGATLEAPVIELGHDPHVVELFDNAVAVAESGNLSTTTKLFHVSQSVAYLLAFLNYRRREPAQYPPTSQERISQCIRFMKQNLKERIELNELAKLSKFSRSRFIAHFREVTGMTVMGYLTNLRMERARDLLLETDRSVKDIAMEAGYPDPYWFSNAFRCMHGMSPTEYREKNLLQ
jgi:AraC family transcriptional regulator of arabinose operon